MPRTIGVSLFGVTNRNPARRFNPSETRPYIALENDHFTQHLMAPAGAPESLFGDPAAPFPIPQHLILHGGRTRASIAKPGDFSP